MPAREAGQDGACAHVCHFLLDGGHLLPDRLGGDPGRAESVALGRQGPGKFLCGNGVEEVGVVLVRGAPGGSAGPVQLGEVGMGCGPRSNDHQVLDQVGESWPVWGIGSEADTLVDGDPDAGPVPALVDQ